MATGRKLPSSLSPLLNFAADVSKYPKACVGFVCRPDVLRALKAEAAKNSWTDSVFASEFSGIPLFEKIGQSAPCRAYFDREELQKYLSGPSDLSSPL